MVDTAPSPALLNHATEFCFGLTRFDWFTQEREPVKGCKVLYRALAGEDFEMADEQAGVFSDPAAQLREREVQYLARAVLAVNGYELPAEMDWRANHLREMPDAFRGRIAKAWVAVQDAYNRLLDEDTVKNS